MTIFRLLVMKIVTHSTFFKNYTLKKKCFALVLKNVDLVYTCDFNQKKSCAEKSSDQPEVEAIKKKDNDKN